MQSEHVRGEKAALRVALAAIEVHNETEPASSLLSISQANCLFVPVQIEMETDPSVSPFFHSLCQSHVVVLYRFKHMAEPRFAYAFSKLYSLLPPSTAASRLVPGLMTFSPGDSY
jgi:hypothetical protein